MTHAPIDVVVAGRVAVARARAAVVLERSRRLAAARTHNGMPVEASATPARLSAPASGQGIGTVKFVDYQSTLTEV